MDDVRTIAHFTSTVSKELSLIHQDIRYIKEGIDKEHEENLKRDLKIEEVRSLSESNDKSIGSIIVGFKVAGTVVGSICTIVGAFYLIMKLV